MSSSARRKPKVLAIMLPGNFSIAVLYKVTASLKAWRAKDTLFSVLVGQTLYEEQTHVPFLIKLPANAKAGESNIYLARHIDLAPTMLHFAGLPKGPMMQGVPLFNDSLVFMNTPATIPFAYAENNFEGIVLQSVLSGDDKKVIRSNENKRKLAPVELYDVAADRNEQNNLAGAGESAQTEKDLLDAIDSYLTICEEGAVEPAAPANVTGELQKELDSLGYFGE